MRDITKKRLIYARYILPPMLMALTLLAMLIPAYLFVTNGEVGKESVSVFTLMKNSYDESRSVLFVSGEHSAAEQVLSRILLGLTIALPILYAVGMAVSVYSAVVAIRYFLSDEEAATEKARTLFITFFPNRIFLFAAQLLILPMCAFPYMMAPIYKNVLGTSVAMVLKAPEGLIFGAASLIVILTLSAICAPMERRFGADIFDKGARDDEGFDSLDEEQELSAQDEIYSDRNAKIRELLFKEKNDQ